MTNKLNLTISILTFNPIADSIVSLCKMFFKHIIASTIRDWKGKKLFPEDFSGVNAGDKNKLLFLERPAVLLDVQSNVSLTIFIFA